MNVSKIVGIIAKARHYLELKNLKELYNTMVYPYLTYCNINWASTYPNRLRSIYIALRKLVKLTTFSSFRETSQPLFKLLKIMNIYEINLCLIANFMYLHYYGKRPETFDNYFVKNDSKHSYNTRSAPKIHIDFKRTNHGKFTLQYRGAIIWNSLPNDLKEVKSSNAFKKALRTHVQSSKNTLWYLD